MMQGERDQLIENIVNECMQIINKCPDDLVANEVIDELKERYN